MFPTLDITNCKAGMPKIRIVFATIAAPFLRTAVRGCILSWSSDGGQTWASHPDTGSWFSNN